METKNGKRLKWGIGSAIGALGLVITLYLSVGGSWDKMNGRVYAGEKKDGVQDAQIESLKEGMKLMRQDVRETRTDVRAIREHLMRP